MNEEVKESVATEEVAEAVAPAAESEQVQKEKESQAQQKKRNDPEYNWAEARRKMQQLEEQNRLLAEQMQSIQKPSAPPVDELANLANDDLVDVATTRKLIQREAAKIAEQVIKQREASTVEERLVSKFSDFSDVVSRENIELLKQTEPELAESLGVYNGDPLKQGVAAYKLIKRLGIGQEEKNSMEKKKAIENSQKPMSVNAVTKQSALGNAHLFENGLTKELKASLWNEMKQAAKGA